MTTTQEIEEALLSREADLAVHSLKDLPTELPAGAFRVLARMHVDDFAALVGVDDFALPRAVALAAYTAGSARVNGLGGTTGTPYKAPICKSTLKCADGGTEVVDVVERHDADAVGERPHGVHARQVHRVRRRQSALDARVVPRRDEVLHRGRARGLLGQQHLLVRLAVHQARQKVRQREGLWRARRRRH